MAYNTPRTWTSPELVTDTMLNEQVRDNFNALAPRGLIVQIGSPGGSALTTGTKAYVTIPFSCTVVGWSLLADVSGSAVLDVYADAWASFPPNSADTIVGSEPPTLSAEQNAQDLTLTTWDGDLDAGDVLAVNIDSASTVAALWLTLWLEPR